MDRRAFLHGSAAAIASVLLPEARFVRPAAARLSLYTHVHRLLMTSNLHFYAPGPALLFGATDLSLPPFSLLEP